MNGFRVTLLILLGITVLALLGIVTIFQSSQEANYEAYLASVKASERQQMLEAHQDRMRRIGPQEEGAQGLTAVEAANKEQQQLVTQEEERNVLASASRKDAAKAPLPEPGQTNEATPEQDKPIGLVSSYNKEWGFIMVKPVADVPMTSGTPIAVRRDGRIVCEADLGEEELDEQSGARLISATIRENQFTRGGSNIPSENFEPAVGDEVIISPYLSSSELRTAEAPADFSQGTADSSAPATGGPQEVPAPLIPMP